MIDDLDKTIRELLNREMTRVQAGQVDIAFFPPNRDWRREGTALNFFLYDVRENATLRQHQWQPIRDQHNGTPIAGNQVMLKRAPLRIDCFYMVTAWSTDPIDEHRLLAECLMALARHTVLNQYELEERQLREKLAQRGEMSEDERAELWDALRFGAGRTPFPTPADKPIHANEPLVSPPATGYLLGQLEGLDHEVRTRVAFHDVMTNPAEIWGSLENTMKAALSYVVTLPIDPWRNLEQVAESVGAATFDIPADPRRKRRPKVRTDGDTTNDAGEKVHKERNGQAETASAPMPENLAYQRPTYVGGVVKVKKPLAEAIEIWLLEKGMSTEIDGQGRFVFRRVPVGDYTLEVRTVKGQSRLAQKKIRVPLVGQSEGHLIIIHIPPLAAETEDKTAKADDARGDSPGATKAG